MAAIKTQRVGCDNATLALGRQLMAYVLAADFWELNGTPDATFRAWPTTIRRKIIGGHGFEFVALDARPISHELGCVRRCFAHRGESLPRRHGRRRRTARSACGLPPEPLDGNRLRRSTSALSVKGRVSTPRTAQKSPTWKWRCCRRHHQAVAQGRLAAQGPSGSTRSRATAMRCRWPRPGRASSAWSSGRPARSNGWPIS